MKKSMMLLLTLVLVGLMQCTVFADTIPETYYRFRNARSNLYLDCDGYTMGSNIRQLYYPSHLNPQKFLVMYNENDYYTIHPYEAMEMAVDVTGASVNNEANIQVYSYNHGSAQNWKFISNGNGTFRVASKCSSDNKVMVIQSASMESGANVFQYTYNATVNDQWYLEPVVEEGDYYIINKNTGLYLSDADNGYLRNWTKDYDDGDFQKFHIKPSSNGYYDISPLSASGTSVEVSCWHLGIDEENSPVIYSYGQSASGQRWRFIVNEDGSYRIMSELSGLTKAITVLSDKPSYVYSTTYAVNNNANWELVPIYDEDDYQKEGKHVIVDLDTNTYLKNNISPANLTRWIQHLDAAYEKYADLVGGTPGEGQKIRIVPVGTNRYKPDEVAAPLYTFLDSTAIFWNKDYIVADLIEIDVNDDWSFGVLHEMGHTFDIDSRWNFNHEFFANFKMAYVLKCFDGQFRVKPAYSEITSYAELKNYYQSGSSKGYNNSLGAANPVFEHDGLLYMFMERLDAENMWGALDDTFKFVLTDTSQSPTKNLDEYNYFMDVLNDMSEEVFLNSFNTTYASKLSIITNYFNANLYN